MSTALKDGSGVRAGDTVICNDYRYKVERVEGEYVYVELIKPKLRDKWRGYKFANTCIKVGKKRPLEEGE